MVNFIDVNEQETIRMPVIFLALYSECIGSSERSRSLTNLKPPHIHYPNTKIEIQLLPWCGSLFKIEIWFRVII